MRAVAVGLLLFAAVVFILTLKADGGWRYVHATAEASMVGALADWFAVTALFRHPLGIPIPHTALIPTRKNMLARSLQEFFTENFLSDEIVRERVATAQPARRVGRWLADPDHQQRVVAELSKAADRVLRRIDDTEMAALIEAEILPAIGREQFSPIVGQLLEAFARDRAYGDAVDLVLAELHRWLLDNPDAISVLVTDRAPSWTPRWVDSRMAGKVSRELLALVSDILADRDHRARKSLDSLVARLAHDLQHDEATMARAERFKQRMLATPQAATAITGLWRVLRGSLTEALNRPDGYVRKRLAQALADFADQLEHNDALSARMDKLAADAATYVASSYGEELTSVITTTIERWDGNEAARRIELHVGRDLQFIRINGTLVGGLAGLVIYSLGQLFG